MSFERVEIGPHVLYRGDCLDVLPTLSNIDAVVMDPETEAERRWAEEGERPVQELDSVRRAES